MGFAVAEGPDISTGPAKGDDRPGRDGLGAIHVRVDDIGPNLRQMGGKDPDGDGIVRLIDDQDATPARWSLRTALPADNDTTETS